jgi:hypothetical protein
VQGKIQYVVEIARLADELDILKKLASEGTQCIRA